ncbi:MAG: manganese catalase family protein [Butyricicoccaceae bacterium]
MWNYQKQLQYPVNIKNPNPAAAKVIITQLGGPDGELGAATRYLNQRYAQPYQKAKAILTDIGIEEGADRSREKRAGALLARSEMKQGCIAEVKTV